MIDIYIYRLHGTQFKINQKKSEKSSYLRAKGVSSVKFVYTFTDDLYFPKQNWSHWLINPKGKIFCQIPPKVPRMLTELPL